MAVRSADARGSSISPSASRAASARSAQQQWERLFPPHVPKCAGSRTGYRVVQVIEEIDQQANDRWLWPGAAAGVGANCRFAMAKQHRRAIRRQPCAE